MENQWIALIACGVLFIILLIFGCCEALIHHECRKCEHTNIYYRKNLNEVTLLANEKSDKAVPESAKIVASAPAGYILVPIDQPDGGKEVRNSKSPPKSPTENYEGSNPRNADTWKRQNSEDETRLPEKRQEDPWRSNLGTVPARTVPKPQENLPLEKSAPIYKGEDNLEPIVGSNITGASIESLPNDTAARKLSKVEFWNGHDTSKPSAGRNDHDYYSGSTNGWGNTSNNAKPSGWGDTGDY